MICFIKIQSENMKMTWNIRCFIFCMICSFFEFDGFVTATMILKLGTAEENSYLDAGWLFIGSFKVGSVPGMINKEVLAKFIYNSA